MLLLKLAFRNIMRNFRRSLINFAVISFGVFVLTVMIGYSDGAFNQVFNSVLKTRTGHIQIHAKGYVEIEEENGIGDEESLKLTIPDYEEVKEITRSLPEVQAISSRIKFVGMLSNGIDTVPVLGMGIEPEEAQITSVIRVIPGRGRYLASIDENKIMIGRALASVMKVDVGDTLTLAVDTSYGAVNALDFEVTGIFRGTPDYEKGMIYIPLIQAQNLLDMDDVASEIVILLDDPNNSWNVTSLLNKEIETEGLEAAPWQDLVKVLVSWLRAGIIEITVINLIFFLIVASTITNTMMMAVFERTQEIGMIMAMGMKKVQIITLFVLEGSILGVISAIFGSALGGAVNYYLSIVGIDFGMDMSSLSMPFEGNVIYFSFKLSTLLLSFFFGVLITSIASLYPAYKASKLEPGEALRTV